LLSDLFFLYCWELNEDFQGFKNVITNAMKSKFQIVACTILFFSCNKEPCSNHKSDIGEVKLTTYDKNILFDRYKPLQILRFIRNKIDTIEFKMEQQFNSADITQESPFEMPCGSSSFCRLQNYGSNLLSNIKDTIFYIRLQTLYENKNTLNFKYITSNDTSSQFEFGFLRKTKNGGTVERTYIDIDKLFIESYLENSVLVNDKLYNKVLITSSVNSPFWRIKEVYFQQEIGIIKFTLFKNEFGNEAGDIFELIQ